MAPFSTITSVGGLLPTDLLSRVAAGDPKLPGIDATDYGLVPDERLNDHITRSWNRLQGLWVNFQRSLAELPDTDRTATSLTRERWLLPLLDELGFGGLPVARARAVGGKEYAISHDWGGQVPVHLPGARIAVDRRTPGVPGAATTSPHGLVQEYLNRSDDNLWGLVSNGLVLRLLRDNASLTRQAYVEFELEAIFEGEAFSDFVVLWLTCHRTRFEGDQPEKCVLEQWSQEAATAGTRALDKLRDGVEAAITALGEGFIAHPGNTELREQLRSGELSTTDYQRQLLRTVYRLLFLLVAESRDLLLDPDADETAKERYRRFYGVERLRILATARRGTTHDDLWESLDVVIGALHRNGASTLGLAPLGSFLWSPDATAGLTGSRLQNRAFLDAIRALTLVRDEESRVHRAVDYRNLGAEELGSIYESLLELHAEVDPDARAFKLATAAGNERKTTGSYYTPTSLITELLDSALDPVLDEAARQAGPEAAILGLSVIDMAIGSGHFVIAAANRIAQRLASVRAGGIEPAPDEVRHALRDVISHCIYGIDVNPMAVELCKVSLWLEAMEPGKPLSFLDHRIVSGNALLGTTPRLLAEGIPDDAYKPLLGDDKKFVTSLKNRNKAERKGQMQLGLLATSVAGLAKPAAEAVAEIDALDDDTVDALQRKQKVFERYAASDGAAKAKLAADAWCAAFVCRKAAGEPEITTDTVRRIADDPSRVDSAVVDRIRALSEEYRFLHMHLAFPDLFAVPEDPDTATNQRTGWSGGASLSCGNPPWERVKLQEKEFFAEREPEIAAAPNAAARKRLIQRTIDEHPALWDDFQRAARNAEGQSHFLRSSGRYPLCGRGDVNTYTVFAEGMRDAIAPTGRVGVIVPSGIATDDTTKFFFQDIVERRNLASLFDFENRRKIFQGIDSRIKFCLLTLSGDARPVDEAEFVFFALDTADLNHPERRFTLSPEDFELLNPNTRTCPIFRGRRDSEVTKGIYQRMPVLLRAGSSAGNPWGISFLRMLDMSNDSHLFRTADELQESGWVLEGNVFVQGVERQLPLYEAKMVSFFDHRAADVVLSKTATVRQGQPAPLSETEHQDPTRLAQPRVWVHEQHVVAVLGRSSGRLLCLRDVTSATNERTVIPATIPFAAVGNNLPVLLTESDEDALLLGAILSSFVVDFCARFKVGGLHLNFFLVEQFPTVAPEVLRDVSPWDPAVEVRKWLLPRIRELTSTAWDIAGASSPFTWDEERRTLLRAEMDAAMFVLFGLDRLEVEHVLGSFPIVRRKDEEKYGEFRTGRLILAAFDRMVEAARTGGCYVTLVEPPPGDPSRQHPETPRPQWANVYLDKARTEELL